MLTIRLTRKGKKNQPFFRVVVVDKKRSSKGGRAVEVLGYVDPLTKRRSINKERVLYWFSKGSQPSPTVHNLLVSEKIIDAKKINKSKKPKKKEGESASAPGATQSVPAAPVVEQAAPTTPSPIVEVPMELPAQIAEPKPETQKQPEPEKPA